MRTLIIDDEPGPRIALRNHIAKYCPGLKVLGESDSVSEGVKLITLHQPELVFLDVRLLDGTAFDLLDRTREFSFHIIFITGYNEYAIRAFQYNALHYILKPFLPEEVQEAVIRAQEAADLTLSDLKSFITNFNSGKEFARIAVPSVSRIAYLEPNEIIRCESDGAYTNLFLEDGTSILSTKPLKEYEQLLSPNGFYRVHRSHLVNLSKVSEYVKKSSDSIVMKDGSTIEVSRNKRADFLKVMS